MSSIQKNFVYLKDKEGEINLKTKMPCVGILVVGGDHRVASPAFKGVGGNNTVTVSRTRCIVVGCSCNCTFYLCRDAEPNCSLIS